MQLLDRYKKLSETSFLACATLTMAGAACVIAGFILMFSVNANLLVAGMTLLSGCALMVLAFAIANGAQRLE